MAKIQTRRTVSLDTETHRRLVAFAAEREIPASQVVTQALEVVFVGAVAIGPAVEMRSRDRGGQFCEPAESEGDRYLRVATDTAKASRADVRRGLSPVVALPLSLRLHEDVVTQAERLAVKPEVVLDQAIGRMLESLERGGWCRSCLEALEHCRCATARTGVR